MILYIVYLLIPSVYADIHLSYQRLLWNNHTYNKKLLIDSFNLKLRRNSQHFKFSSDIKYFPNELGAAYSLSELFYKRKYLWIGRKILNWNKASEDWNLGIINAPKGFNLMHKARDGVVGISLRNSKNSTCSIQMIYSPLSIPQINPSLINKNGKMIAQNDWSEEPPAKIITNGLEAQINYNITMPKIKDFLLNPLYAINFGCKAFAKIHVFYFDKPENQIRMYVNGGLDLQTFNVILDVKPVIDRQQVTGISLEKNINTTRQKSSFLMSLIKVKPSKRKEINFTIPRFNISPVYVSESYLFVTYLFKSNSLPLGLGLSYIHSFENRKYSDVIFAKKLLWLDAISIDLKYKFGNRFFLHINHKYDSYKKDVLSYGSLIYRYNNISYSLGYQFLDIPTNQSFWSIFRSNDQLFTKIDITF